MSGVIFVIANSDGDTTVRQMTEAEFVEQIGRGWYGDAPVFIRDLDEADTNCWPEDAICVIRGSLVTPMSKEMNKVWYAALSRRDILD